MAKECFKRWQPKGSSKVMIAHANAILDELMDQGYTLTLRQLYYQLVARGTIPNRQSEYKRLGSIVNDARLAGLIDWDAIEDRTRNLRSVPHYEEMLTSQGGGCAICGRKAAHNKATKRLHVDHCHKTGEVRGLLCSRCNTQISILGDDDAEQILRVLNYLGWNACVQASLQAEESKA